MVLVGALLASKFTQNSSVEHFKNSMLLDETKELQAADYNKAIFNSSLNFVLLCVIIFINIVPALLIAYHCSKTTGQKATQMTIALIFSDIYIFYYAIRKYYFKDEKFCS